jgi:hypothetical protein
VAGNAGRQGNIGECGEERAAGTHSVNTAEGPQTMIVGRCLPRMTEMG